MRPLAKCEVVLDGSDPPLFARGSDLAIKAAEHGQFFSHDEGGAYSRGN